MSLAHRILLSILALTAFTAIPSAANAASNKVRRACPVAVNDNEPSDDVLSWAQNIRELREQLRERLRTTRDPKRIILTADETRLLLAPSLRTLTKIQLSANEAVPEQLLARVADLRFEILTIIHGATLEDAWRAATEASALSKAALRGISN